MLNRAARYYPLLRILREREIPSTVRLLEVGSGPIGIGEFRKAPFVGCDVEFSSRPVWPMNAVRASALELPFRDRSFSVVIVSDVMEHLPSGQRQDAVAEALRVSGKIAIFAFPAGARAQDLDRELSAYYAKRRKPIPVWLEEHMQHPFPDSDVFSRVPTEWKGFNFGNENEEFHLRMMKMESWRVLAIALRLGTTLFPRISERLLAKEDHAPFYRQIFVFERTG